MERYLSPQIVADLSRKMVILTGPRQVGKTTLGRQLMARYDESQYLNWDVLVDQAILKRQSWNPRAKFLVFDEIHKMPAWKSWLKGVVDAKPPDQHLMITGSARMDTYRQSGESLSGRYLGSRLHPISVKEYCDQSGATPDDALTRILRRGGFPEPFLLEADDDVERWRRQYATDLIREDVVEFSRLHEVSAMRNFFELLRERVGAQLSLASMARDLAISPTTLKRYLEVLQALYIVFVIQPWHRNVARALLQAPKVYFFDTGLVKGDEGVRFENAVAGMLLKHVQFLQDSRGIETQLHYLRTKDGAEVDFCLSKDDELTHLIECKVADNVPHRALARFAQQFSQAESIQLVRDLRQQEFRQSIHVVSAGRWLANLAA